MTTVFRRGSFELVWNDTTRSGYLVAEIQEGQAITETLLADNVVADFDPDGRLLGIELLGGSTPT